MSTTPLTIIFALILLLANGLAPAGDIALYPDT
jgi:hypothetical protein